MPDYRLYCVGEDGHITNRHDYAGKDDLDALAQAQKLCGQHEIEVWEGARFVTRVGTDGSASLTPPNGPHPN